MGGVKKPQTELSKSIKRINWKLSVWEKKGLGESWQVKAVIRKAEKLGLEVGTSKSGFTKIVNKKSYADKQEVGVMSIEKSFPSVSKTAKKVGGKLQGRGVNVKGLKDTEIIEKFQEESSKTHDFIEAHKNDIYKFQDLTSWVKRSGKLTQEEEDKLLNMYERRKEDLVKIAEKETKERKALLGIDIVEKESED